MAEFDLDDDVSRPDGLTSSKAFPALVALWFAALFGGGCLFLPPVLFDMVFGGNSPFGPQTRIVVALGAAGIGLLLGLFIASRVRDDGASAAAPTVKKSRKRDTRPPLDVRAALGLGSDDDEDEDEDEEDDFDPPFADDADLSDAPDHDAFDLTDEVRPPIDDPYFASAWSDSDAYNVGELDEAPVAPTPAWTDTVPQETERAAPYREARDPQPTRYNPFAEFIASDEGEDLRQAPASDEPEPTWETASWEPAPHAEPDRPAASDTAPPPPPVWSRARAEEPALQELGVAELVERLARALQGQQHGEEQGGFAGSQQQQSHTAPPRSGSHRHESALAPGAAQTPDIDRALRGALDRLSRLDDVA
ncbi:hypothetical protein [Citromicrobium bathyomarinum]|uniref:hypothetical protein n=1 Tax=Citromicrobium bathyomarinum TaxID=72174 RepID=UPI003159F019